MSRLPEKGTLPWAVLMVASGEPVRGFDGAADGATYNDVADFDLMSELCFRGKWKLEREAEPRPAHRTLCRNPMGCDLCFEHSGPCWKRSWPARASIIDRLWKACDLLEDSCYEHDSGAVRGFLHAERRADEQGTLLFAEQRRAVQGRDCNVVPEDFTSSTQRETLVLEIWRKIDALGERIAKGSYVNALAVAHEIPPIVLRLVLGAIREADERRSRGGA